MGLSTIFRKPQTLFVGKPSVWAPEQLEHFQVSRISGQQKVVPIPGQQTGSSQNFGQGSSLQGGGKYATYREHEKRRVDSQDACEKNRGSDCALGRGAGRSLLKVPDQGPPGPFQKGAS